MRKINIVDYKPRTQVPSKTDPYYISDKYGGYSPCILGKPNYNNGRSILANCVGYCFMDWWEKSGINTRVGCPAGTNKPTTAKYWWSQPDGYERGSIPKIGSIACFRPAAIGSGHVATVTDIQKNYIQLAESGYGGYIFRTVKAYQGYCLITKDGKTTRHYNYKFNPITKKLTKTFNVLQGYIYPPFIDYTPRDVLQAGDKVKILGSGNSRSDGNGKTTGGVGWVRYILAIDNTAEYPYRVGSSKGVTTGYYKAGALGKVD